MYPPDADLGVKDTPAIDGVPREWLGHPGLLSASVKLPADRGCTRTLVCFVPGLKWQWWHRFACSRHQHVFAMRALGDGGWLIVEPWWSRMLVSVLTAEQAARFLRWAAEGDILRVTEWIPGRGSQLSGWSSCAVLTRLLLGRSYRTEVERWARQRGSRLIADGGRRRNRVVEVSNAQFGFEVRRLRTHLQAF
jgi:hypothetical protein